MKAAPDRLHTTSSTFEVTDSGVRKGGGYYWVVKPGSKPSGVIEPL
jgi:hypothetical protein